MAVGQEGAGGGRPGRRGGGRGGRTAPGFAQPPFRQPRLPFPPVAAVSGDALEAIHTASLRVLEEIGLDFLHEEARAILGRAGAAVESGSPRVRLDAGLVLEAIRTAPAEFILHARNPAHDLRFGGAAIVLSPVSSAPNCSDLERGRRPGSRADFQNLVRLGQACNILHMTGGYPVEPVDLHPSIRHLDCLADIVKLTDKSFQIYSLGRGRNLDGLEIARIGRGVDEARFEREPSILSTINSSSPLRLDAPMLQGIIEMARRNQPIVMTPFTLAGAMAPVTIAGALVQQNAEALAGIAFAQMVRPGAPVVYGGFTSNVDMKSGAPAFGTPEYMKAALVGGQLARRYRVPYRSSNANAANTVDAQAAYESVQTMWGAFLSGANYILHSAGWNEAGLGASFAKFVLDCEQIEMFYQLGQGPQFGDLEAALAAVREIGPGGHYLGTAHTREHFQTAFFMPELLDNNSFEQWELDGAKDANQRGLETARQMLANYEPPPLDPAIDEQLQVFIREREAVLPDSMA